LLAGNSDPYSRDALDRSHDLTWFLTTIQSNVELYESEVNGQSVACNMADNSVHVGCGVTNGKAEKRIGNARQYGRRNVPKTWPIACTRVSIASTNVSVSCDSPSNSSHSRSEKFLAFSLHSNRAIPLPSRRLLPTFCSDMKSRSRISVMYGAHTHSFCFVILMLRTRALCFWISKKNVDHIARLFSQNPMHKGVVSLPLTSSPKLASRPGRRV
jgi:hypothetical protein